MTTMLIVEDDPAMTVALRDGFEFEKYTVDMANDGEQAMRMVARGRYDVIILDLPAILVNSDAILLTDLADGIICVVRAGLTSMALLNRAVEQIEEGKLRGVVINGTASAIPGWLRRLAGM